MPCPDAHASELHQRPFSIRRGLLAGQTELLVRGRRTGSASAPYSPNPVQVSGPWAVADEQLRAGGDPVMGDGEVHRTAVAVEVAPDVADGVAGMVEPGCHGKDPHSLRKVEAVFGFLLVSLIPYCKQRYLVNARAVLAICTNPPIWCSLTHWCEKSW